MLEELYEILSCWPEEFLFSSLFIDSEGKRKRSSAGKLVLEKEQLFFLKAEASFPNYQKGFFVELFGWCWPLLLSFLFSKDAIFMMCMFAHNIKWKMQKCLKEQNNVYYSRLLSWSYWALKFLSLFWTSSAGLSALYRVSCMS